MALKVVWSNRFKKDYVKAKKRGLDLEKLNDLIVLLSERKPLSVKYKDHQLTGNYENFRECHIEQIGFWFIP